MPVIPEITGKEREGEKSEEKKKTVEEKEFEIPCSSWSMAMHWVAVDINKHTDIRCPKSDTTKRFMTCDLSAFLMDKAAIATLVKTRHYPNSQLMQLTNNIIATSVNQSIATQSAAVFM